MNPWLSAILGGAVVAVGAFVYLAIKLKNMNL